MDTERVELNVFFEEPFWVGVFERISKGRLSVCKVTFGAEPKDYDIWDFILKHYDKLKFSPSIEAEVRKTADNPKRRQRDAKKQLSALGMGTKSQQVLQMQHELEKAQRKQIRKERQEDEKKRRFDLRQQKRKAKHRGR